MSQGNTRGMVQAWTAGLIVTAGLWFAPVASAQVQRTFVNPGFEAPVLPNNNCWSIRPSAQVPGWRTTEPVFNGPWITSTFGTCGGHPASPPVVEAMQIFRGTGGPGTTRPPNAGNQFAELNAYTPSRLYQSVCLLNGEQLDWALAHAPRSNANEVAVFNIGTAINGAGAQEIVRMRAGNTVAQGPVSCSLGTCSLDSIDANGWREYSGTFSWSQPTGTQTIGFQAASGGSAGNVLDDIRIGLRPFVEFAQPAYTQNEGSPTGNRPRLLVAGRVPAGGITVPVTITGGTATLGLDYTTASGTTDVSVFIPAGDYDSSSFPLPITIVNDGPGDPGETITFNTPETAGTGAPYNRASLQSCGGVPLADTESTISEDPDPLPRIQLNKALSADRLAVSDQFLLRIDGINGQQTTTTGAGSAVGNGGITVGPATAGTVYTLSEVMAGGSPSPLSAYSPSISCTNTTPGSPTVLPGGSGSSFNLTVIATDNISCVITNEVASEPDFIDVVKTVTGGDLYSAVGDIATYSYVVTNTGAAPVDTLTVTDNRIATVNCPVTTLAAAPGPGNSTTCTGSYTVTASDITDTLVTNIATARARSTATGLFAIDTDDAVIHRAFPAITADKASTETNYATVGQVIPYTYVVVNTGNTEIDALTVTDNRVPVVACPLTTLNVGQSTTCTGDYTITQADIDAGSVTNVMTATGTPPAGTLEAITDTVTITATAATPAVTLDKSATAGAPYTTVGDVVDYEYLVTNTGNVTISALTVTDDRIATVTCPVTTLAPGADTTCTGSYTITQADLDAGSVTNNATAGATPARGTLTPATDSATVNATAAPTLSLDKTAVSGNPYAAVGDVVDYEYVVTNTGNVTISALTVTDDRIATVTCPLTTLAPGADTTCTGSYTVTQADLDAGLVTNLASATGTPAGGTLVPATDSETVNATATPALTLDKATATVSYATVGQVVPYSYLVTNTGNVTITALTVTDDRIAAVSCALTTLAPGANTTCTGNYTITQADLDAGSVTNNASATGTPASGTLVPATDSVTVNAAATPALTLDKTVVSGNPYDTLGDTVGYQYLVTNTGNVTISALIVTDDRIATVTCALTTLAPGADTTCTGSYTITQADLDDGLVTNNASATGTPASGTLVPATDSATATSSSTPALTLAKTAVSGNPYAAVGDVVGYEYLVTNPSSVTINALTVTDDRIATVTCPVATLAPGASTTCTGSYTITQADLDAGSVTNNAIASGTPASGTLVPGTDSATVNATRAPALTLDKTAVSGNPYATVGDVVSYDYVVTNTGNVTINALAVTDDRIATVVCPVTTLAPAAFTTCTGSYTITQADLDAGSVINVATATGTPVGGTLAPVTDNATVNATATPALTLDKTVVAGDPYDAVGDVINYQYVVTNTGNVTISALAVADDRIAAVTCPTATLAPGEIATCTGSYFTTQADLDAGSVVNNASATGTPANGTLTPATDTATATATATPSLTLDKTVVAGALYAAVGDVVDYQYAVANTGNVTINALTVTDDKIATVTCPVTTLAPGADTTCTGSYTITQADLDAGLVTNIASATGTPTVGTLVPATDTVTVNALPSVGYAKAAGTAGPVVVGETISYTVTVTVAYAVTRDTVTLVDTLGPGLDFVGVTATGAFTCNVAGQLVCTLPAGTAPGTYPVTYQAQVNARATGTVDNAVLGSGNDNPTCSADCSIEMPVAAPTVTYGKATGTAGPVAVGDAVAYTLTTTVANSLTTGVVTLTDTLGPGLDFVAVTSAGAYTCNAANPLVCTLPAGTVPGTYVLNYQARVNASASGTVDNTVAGGGIDDPSCAPDCEASLPVAAPVVTVAKSSDPAPGTEVQFDQAIAYTLSVTVANSATLADVVLVDTPDPGLTVTALPAGCLATGATITCTLPAGTPAGLHTFVYTATVNAQAGATVNNAVTASSPGQPAPACEDCALSHPVAASELRIAKAVAVREVRIGDLVRYTLTVENLGAGSLSNGSVVDTPPAGFTYVEGSLVVVDGDNAATVEGFNPLRFGGLDLAGGDTATLVYLLRVGAGVRPGVHENQAQAFSPTTGEPISNVATARVELVADPLMDDSLILGTVFDDRDGDGWQDDATLDGVRVQGGFAPEAYIADSTTIDRGTGPQAQADASAPLLHGIDVGNLPGRQSEAAPAHAVVIRQYLRELAFTDGFVLTSDEGVTVRMDADGGTTLARSGEAAKGLNAAVPTVQRRVAAAEGGYVVDYVIGNAGIHERGLPGVRIASVEGLLIETDQYGRYHLAGMPGGPAERGRNFLLKVDPATLPAGAEFTTDNPLLRRITPGLPARFDWGVRLPVQVIEGREQVELELGEVFFAPDSAVLRPQAEAVVEKIAATVREYRGGEVVVTATAGDEGLALERALAVKQALLERLDAESAAALVVSVRTRADDPSSQVAGVAEGGLLLGTVLFDTDQATIRPGFEPLLDQIAAALEQAGGGAVAIVGHTDRRASYDYNAELGLRRAKAVYDALAKRLSPELRARVRVDASGDPVAPVGMTREQEGSP